jgi:hypothetical protein
MHGHAFYLDAEKPGKMPRHYHIARRIAKTPEDRRYIPICAIDRDIHHSALIIKWTEQLFIVFFEAWNAALLGRSIPVNATVAESQVTLSWSQTLSKQLHGLVEQLKARPQFNSFRWPSERKKDEDKTKQQVTEEQHVVKGCNWQSPILEHVFLERCWTRTTLPDEDGKPAIYQFRGPIRLVHWVRERLYFNVMFTPRDVDMCPRGLAVGPEPEKCPGLEQGSKVNVVIEIMVDSKKRHPTPFLPVPAVGPCNVWAEAARLAIKGEYQSKDGQWKSATFSGSQHGILRLILDPKYNRWRTNNSWGPHADQLIVKWIQVMKLMGTGCRF